MRYLFQRVSSMIYRRWFMTERDRQLCNALMDKASELIQMVIDRRTENNMLRYMCHALSYADAILKLDIKKDFVPYCGFDRSLYRHFVEKKYPQIEYMLEDSNSDEWITWLHHAKFIDNAKVDRDNRTALESKVAFLQSLKF